MGNKYYFNGSLLFEVLYPDGAERNRTSQTEVIHIPYSDTNYVYLGGQMEIRLPYRIKLSSLADYNTMESLVGASARTLTGPDFSGSASAVLVSLERQTYYRDGTQIATANFIITAS